MELTFAELVERLIIANIKLTKFDHLKANEIMKEEPDSNKVVQWERGSRTANEDRARARNAINVSLDKAIKDGKNTFVKEARTFGH